MLGKIFSSIWLVVFICLGLLTLYTTPQAIESSKYHFERFEKPSVIYVDSFKKSSGRLPTIDEFIVRDLKISLPDYQRMDSIAKDIKFLELSATYIRNNKDLEAEDFTSYPKNIDWNKDYAISFRHHDWKDYYTSWNQKYITGGFGGWSDSIGGSIEMLLVGLIPFLFRPTRNAIKKYIGKLSR